jgi:hypothetical protein
MMRDPKIQEQKRLQKKIRFRQITPIIFYRECLKCGMEYKLEPVWEYRGEVKYEFLPVSEVYHYHGCKHCFPSVKDFRDYLKSQNCINI